MLTIYSDLQSNFGSQLRHLQDLYDQPDRAILLILRNGRGFVPTHMRGEITVLAKNVSQSCERIRCR